MNETVLRAEGIRSPYRYQNVKHIRDFFTRIYETNGHNDVRKCDSQSTGANFRHKRIRICNLSFDRLVNVICRPSTCSRLSERYLSIIHMSPL